MGLTYIEGATFVEVIRSDDATDLSFYGSCRPRHLLAFSQVVLKRTYIQNVKQSTSIKKATPAFEVVVCVKEKI